LTAALAAAGVLEIVALAALLPFVNVVMQPSAIHTSSTLRRLYRWSGASDVSPFIVQVGTVVIALMMTSAIVNWSLLYLQNRYAAACQNRLAKDLLDRCMQAPYSWFLGRNSLVLSRLVYDDVVVWSRGLIQRLMTMVNSLLSVLMAVALVLAFSLRTGIAVVVGVAILGYAAVYLTRPYLARLAETKRGAMDAVTLTANQALAGIKDIKLSSREAYFSELFRRAYATFTGAHAGLNVGQETPSALMTTLAQVMLVGLAMALWSMGVEPGRIATQLALIIIVSTKVVPSVGMLSMSVSGLVNSLPHVRAIHDVLTSLEVKGKVSSREGPGLKRVDGWRRVRLEKVGYQYPDASGWALRECSIALERSGAYGIVGPSAAGKSTLVDLLVGLLEPTEGRVWVDDDPLETLAPKSWQRRIGYVPQAPFIADASLRDNVAFGVPENDVDDARVMECLRLANVAELPAQLERGLDTRLGERGSRLSGGQRQRIAIARALYAGPELLVFDEATSALDSISEAEILAALDNLRGRMAVIIIAHRLSTVASCDQIFVLEEGRLVGCGTYRDLATSHPLFRQMVGAGSALPVET
jgi:ABC-type multidrug transport system fused ATPase/permease subunit